jgi:cellulose synthase/poly-beta-1,6-N-acetylglucosamine synthase-like glycosyltransferase/glycosyltransferase involved in cell wall biosynthesis/O-antigen/teichoic acid export membrane protein
MALKTNKLVQYWQNTRLGRLFQAKFGGPQHSFDHKQPGMIGSGVSFRKNSYVTHTTLHHSKSAISTFVPWQIMLILGLATLIAAGFVFSPLNTAITLVAILSFVYLVDVFFNLFVIMKSLHMPPEISVGSDKLARLDAKKLPIYSILCPLYKEAHVLPQFVEAMSKMDWPADRLEVMLLLEADDQVTIDAARAMKLPSNFRIVVVPDSKPKTKPKACNYGLGMAKGEFIVVYDAEDQPDPLQLKQAYYAFKTSGKEVVCLQAKLNYYNPTHNMLTRLFTAEYSLWFDVILPGLQSINTSIPLGGTSNHFRTTDLRELEGWDPFNVTEDCDLGARIFQAGYKTAIIDSTTLEEANSDVKNWFRQRSRWLKGYMQTYLVHMRNPISFMRRQGIHSLIFQLIVGGRIAFILINPILWILTISYFILYAKIGPAIEAIYPGAVFYMAVTSLLLGNFTYLYNYMIGCAKRGHWNLVKYVFLIPIYWLMISYAATIALFQLFFKPHYWEKTIHGLHLNHAANLDIKKLKKLEASTSRGKKFQKVADFVSGEIFASGVLILASLFGNVLNYLYNAYLGRNLDLGDFGTLSLMGSFLYLANVPFTAIGRSVTHKTAYLYGEHKSAVKEFWLYVRKNSYKIAFGFSLVWLAATPLLKNFFHTPDSLPFIMFAPVWVIGILASIDAGYLSGNLRFTSVAILAVAEALSKLLFSIMFVAFGIHDFVYAAIPLSMGFAFLVQWYFIKSIKVSKLSASEAARATRFPRKFFFTSILTTLTSISYLSLDLLLAKHYLSPADAGSYSYLTLAGKMVFLMGGLVSQFLVPMVSRDLGAGKKDHALFLKILIMVVGINVFTFTFFGLLGSVTVPFLWGQAASTIGPYLPLYSFAMVCYSVSSLLISYRQVRGEYSFSVIGFILGLVQVVGMIIWHDSIATITVVVAFSAILSLLVIGFMHIFYAPLIVIGHNLLDLFGIFGPLPQKEPLPSGKLRILIFNWRDLKHKWAGGAEVYIHELSKRWVKEGNEVTVFCGNDGNSPRHAKIDGVHIIRRGGFFMVYFWAFMYYRVRLRGHYDVIIDSENGLPFFTPLYAREKIFLLIHHVHQEVFRKSLVPPFSWFAQFLEKRVMPIVYRKTEVLTVSPSSKAEIINHHLTKHDPHVVYNGVNLDVCVPGVKTDHPSVLYLGRLTTAKSVNILILAVKKIITQIPSVRVTIAGDGPHKHNLVKMVKSLKLEKYITFTGKVTEEEKLQLYKESWVFVNPSLIEGWGITTIEANACGTPVVASNVAGLRDAVHNPHSGFLIPYGNVDEFASSISLLLTDRKVRNTMSRESVEWAQKFDWNKSAKEGLKILK